MVDGRGFWSVSLFLLGLWELSSLGLLLLKSLHCTKYKRGAF